MADLDLATTGLTQQQILDALIGTYDDRPLSVINAEGDRIGEIFQDSTYGLVLRAKDTDDNSLPVTLVGSSVVLGSDNTLIKFNGAQEDNFLQLGTPIDVDGVTLFPLNATPLNVEVYSEEFTNNADIPLTTSYQTIVSGVTANEYQADTSIAQVQFRVVNTSNQSREITYYITANGAPPTPGDEFTATVPGKSGGDDGVILISTNDTSTTLVNIGDAVTCEMLSSGNGLTVTGTVLETTLKITQNTGIQQEVQALNNKVPETAIAEYSANPASMPIQLTDTYQVVTDWVFRNPPIGISESSGVFAIENGAIHDAWIGRAYRNEDQNPSDVVILYVLVEKNEGAGWETVFERSSTMSSATSAQEPAVIQFTTDFMAYFTDGELIRVSFKATDNGVTPQEVYLTDVNITTHAIANLPE